MWLISPSCLCAPVSADLTLLFAAILYKYARIVHAEANALLNCEGDRLGATMYVTGCPCPACMNLIVAAGIKRVVIGLIESACVDDVARITTEVIAHDCGVRLERLDTNVGAIVSAALLGRRAS